MEQKWKKKKWYLYSNDNEKLMLIVWNELTATCWTAIFFLFPSSRLLCVCLCTSSSFLIFKCVFAVCAFAVWNTKRIENSSSNTQKLWRHRQHRRHHQQHKHKHEHSRNRKISTEKKGIHVESRTQMMKYAKMKQTKKKTIENSFRFEPNGERERERAKYKYKNEDELQAKTFASIFLWFNYI